MITKLNNGRELWSLDQSIEFLNDSIFKAGVAIKGYLDTSDSSAPEEILSGAVYGKWKFVNDSLFVLSKDSCEIKTVSQGWFDGSSHFDGCGFYKELHIGNGFDEQTSLQVVAFSHDLIIIKGQLQYIGADVTYEFTKR